MRFFFWFYYVLRLVIGLDDLNAYRIAGLAGAIAIPAASFTLLKDLILPWPFVFFTLDFCMVYYLVYVKKKLNLLYAPFIVALITHPAYHLFKQPDLVNTLSTTATAMLMGLALHLWAWGKQGCYRISNSSGA
jgi:hypothetical protein